MQLQQPQQKSTHSPYILGLDVGTNSIGWAVVDCALEAGDHQGQYAGYAPLSLRALNSRIFLEMVDAKTRVPKNQKRRQKRGERNRRAYYKKRRKELVGILLKTGLLPENYHADPNQTLLQIDRQFAERKLGKPWSKDWSDHDKAYCSPYAIRYFALQETLKPHELGRVLLHLQRRRGYFSNRGAKYIELIKRFSLEMPDDKQKKKPETKEEKNQQKEMGIVLKGIQDLEERLKGRVLGEFIWEEAQVADIAPQRVTIFERLQLRATREMYEQEFNAIRERQKETLPEATRQSVEDKIEQAIFHQRPMQLQKSKVGHCNVYPNRKRTAKMRLEYQEFRTLQMINNVKIDHKPLTSAQREQLLSMANDPKQTNEQSRIAWKDVAAMLKVSRRQLNYDRQGDEGEGKTGLTGNRTVKEISKSIGIQCWHDLGEHKQKQLVEDLLSINNKCALYDRLVNHYGFTPYDGKTGEAGQALELTMNEDLEDDYAEHSLKAINALLPHLRAGHHYYDAMKKIDRIGSITPTFCRTGEATLLTVEDVPNIANPIVQKALYEMRRVINAIIRRYGPPAIIRLEMAREMKAARKHRAQIESQQKENRKRNETADKEICEYVKNGEYKRDRLEHTNDGTFRISNKDREKYKMWKNEQNEQCPYCRNNIGFNELFSGKAEIEHILPYTGFRQNYLNTIVSCQTCNQLKGKRTPYETWGGNKEQWKRIEEFTKKHFNKKSGLLGKQQNILKKSHQPEQHDDFVQQQLNDTRYIARATRKMLEKINVPVDVNNGQATSELRRKWGLNDVLARDPEDEPYMETGEITAPDTGELLNLKLFNEEKAKKSRRDHRHHAIDAFVVAMTDRAMLKAMVNVHQQEQDRRYNRKGREKTREDWIKETRLALPKSWKDDDNLHGLLNRKLNATVVSHMTKRKVWGALHGDTRYSKSFFSQTLNIDYRLPCMTMRKVLDGKLLSGIYNKDKQWNPGKGTWIAEKSIHDRIYQWLIKNDLLGRKPIEIDAMLKASPPNLPNKRGKPVPIHRVRIARVIKCINIAGSYVETGSNHHLVLFDNGKQGKEKERKVCMVTMLEAARRASAGEPVINKKAPPEWSPPQCGEKWQYALHLCVNDTVHCDDLSIFERKEKFAPEHKKTPYFRVQKINSTKETKVDISLRHHSVSGVGPKWGLWRISSLSDMAFTTVQTGNLGLTLNDSQDC